MKPVPLGWEIRGDHVFVKPPAGRGWQLWDVCFAGLREPMLHLVYTWVRDTEVF